MNEKLLKRTAEIVSAYVKNNRVPMGELASVVSDVSVALDRLANPSVPEDEKPVPAVHRKRSVFSDHIVCLEDGLRFKSLKRHLMTSHGMTPEEYREKWELPADYPMVAPSYATRRSELARQIGLGRRPEPATAKKTRTRQK